jgi:hypothetical protein
MNVRQPDSWFCLTGLNTLAVILNGQRYTTILPQQANSSLTGSGVFKYIVDQFQRNGIQFMSGFTPYLFP